MTRKPTKKPRKRPAPTVRHKFKLNIESMKLTLSVTNPDGSRTVLKPVEVRDFKVEDL